MISDDDKCKWYRQYDLLKSRDESGVRREPAPHQKQALQKLDNWYSATREEVHGGILVLPTGGGKTFTAIRFLCRNVISDGWKVLWLAHTHHLLEQAFVSFEHGVSFIAEPKPQLNVRVVSGTLGHFKVADIEPSDDVLVASLQTTSKAWKNGHERLINFVDAAAGKLFVVFDEAHHAPAPSYRALLTGLKGTCPNARFLGLTATPTYSDECKKGWLARLFPQGIVADAKASDLMAAGILAQPELIEAQTTIEPVFDEHAYDSWIGTYRDLPEQIINHLAEDNSRNDYIVNFYVNGLSGPKPFGKTIIFADRWYQCERLREGLIARGVRADVIYSHVDADPRSEEARRKRTADENAKVLQRFRDDELDVLINVRMLTEGTDIPKVQTVFLTRQTTSQILLTQMVGRALRGPKFNGTDKAYIVSFIDDWKHRINWASYDQIAEGMADEKVSEYGKRPPLQLISIDIVRRLARQMDSGINVNPGPYKTFLPVGWYRVEFDADVVPDVEGPATDDVEQVRLLVMVFEQQKQSFENFFDVLAEKDVSAFGDTSVKMDDFLEELNAWKSQFFDSVGETVGSPPVSDLFAIVRHIAQNEHERPRFFPFETRDLHDLDGIASECVMQDHGPRAVNQLLRAEYANEDRFWRTIYPHYDLFKSHCDACVNRILHALEHGGDPVEHRPSFSTPQAMPDSEPSDETKREVKTRDGGRCVCCGSPRNLEVDHIKTRYVGGRHDERNLQTLCGVCHGIKTKLGEMTTIDFRRSNTRTQLTMAPAKLPDLKMPRGKAAKSAKNWKVFVRRFINFYYRCSAVESVEIGARGERLQSWEIRLFQGNEPTWLVPHLSNLADRIRKVRKKSGFVSAPKTIDIVR